MSAPAPVSASAPARTPLTARAQPETAQRLARSAAATEGACWETASIEPWLAAQAAEHAFRVERIPFAELDGWSFAADTGDLVHRSGRFFTVEGVHATHELGPFPEWYQPLINQPEVGILGLLCKEFDGVLHFLMQAKMEPGNRNTVQLSPTVQATRSNYTQAHRGSAVRYIEHFLAATRGTVLADSLQSEHGSWFLHKSNRNMIVETTADVPEHPGFRWLTLGQINALLHRDNVVNMDARTVLACAPLPAEEPDGEPGARLGDPQLLSWITEERSRRPLRISRVPLRGLPGWVQGPDAIRHEEGRFFEVVGVDVRAGTREVGQWTQPLFRPVGTGVTAFLTRSIGGVEHVLVRARYEPGFPGGMELGPTVQCTPGNYTGVPDGQQPPYLELVQRALAGRDPARLRYAALHSEEGGRFLHAESHYALVAVGADEVPDTPPDGFAWLTPGQLGALVRHEHYLNVQARTLLACLRAARA